MVEPGKGKAGRHHREEARILTLSLKEAEDILAKMREILNDGWQEIQPSQRKEIERTVECEEVWEQASLGSPQTGTLKFS